MYHLQLRSGVKADTWKTGRGSGSISELKGACTASNTDYRIIDKNGNVIWQDLWPRKGGK